MRNVRARLAIALGVTMLLAAVAAQGDGVAEPTVSASVARWVDAVNGGDDAGFSALHTHDVLARHAGGAIDIGPTAVARWARDLQAAGLRIVLEDLIGEAVTDDLVYARAVFRTLDAAGDLEQSGVWYAVLRRSDGDWRFYRTHDLARPVEAE